MLRWNAAYLQPVLDVLTQDAPTDGCGRLGGTAIEPFDGLLDAGWGVHQGAFLQICLHRTRKQVGPQGAQNHLHMKSLGDQAKEYRLAREWDVKRMALEVGTSRQNIESLERSGNRIPKYIGQLAAAMKTPTDVLLSRAGLGGFDGNLFTEDTEGGYSVSVLSTTGSMGPGADQHDDVVVGRLTLSPSWVSKTLGKISKPQNLRFIHGYGDSMEPTFKDGDVLLVDSGVQAVDIDAVYVLEVNQRIYIKRVRQKFDGTYEISSDNSTIKTVDVLDGSQPVKVLGRVVWLWNGRKM